MEGNTMTKKDYELFASEIRKETINQDLTNREIALLVSVLSEVFQKDNPLFNAEKFQDACLTGKHIRKSIKEGC